MSVLEPMLSTIKLHAKNGWALGDLVEGQPLELVLDLVPSTRAAATPKASRHRAPPTAAAAATSAAAVGSAADEGSSDEGEEEGTPSQPQPESAVKEEAEVVVKEEAPAVPRPQRRAAAVSRLSFLKVASHERSVPALEVGNGITAPAGNGQKPSPGDDAHEGAAPLPKRRAKKQDVSEMAAAEDGAHPVGSGGGRRAAHSAKGSGFGRMPVMSEGAAEAAEAEAASALAEGDDTLVSPWHELFQEVRSQLADAEGVRGHWATSCGPIYRYSLCLPVRYFIFVIY